LRAPGPASATEAPERAALSRHGARAARSSRRKIEIHHNAVGTPHPCPRNDEGKGAERKTVPGAGGRRCPRTRTHALEVSRAGPKLSRIRPGSAGNQKAMAMRPSSSCDMCALTLASSFTPLSSLLPGACARCVEVCFVQLGMDGGQLPGAESGNMLST